MLTYGVLLFHLDNLVSHAFWSPEAPIVSRPVGRFHQNDISLCLNCDKYFIFFYLFWQKLSGEPSSVYRHSLLYILDSKLVFQTCLVVKLSFCSKVFLSNTLHMNIEQADGYKNRGCFDMHCPGFVQVSRKNPLGDFIVAISTRDRWQYYIDVIISRVT